MNTQEQLKEAFDQWVQPRLASHEEPTRIGVQRGDPIGLSKQKYLAAQAQVLHSQFTLAKIADIVEVTPVQIRVWRTQKIFNTAAQEALQDFKKYLFENLFNCQEDIDKFTKYLLCLSVMQNGAEFIAKNIAIHVRRYLVTYELMEANKFGNLLDDLRTIQKLYDKLVQVLPKGHKGLSKSLYIKQNLIDYLNGIVDMFDNIASPALPEHLKDKASNIILIVTTINKIIRLFIY